MKHPNLPWGNLKRTVKCEHLFWQLLLLVTRLIFFNDPLYYFISYILWLLRIDFLGVEGLTLFENVVSQFLSHLDYILEKNYLFEICCWGLMMIDFVKNFEIFFLLRFDQRRRKKLKYLYEGWYFGGWVENDWILLQLFKFDCLHVWIN